MSTEGVRWEMRDRGVHSSSEIPMLLTSPPHPPLLYPKHLGKAQDAPGIFTGLELCCYGSDFGNNQGFGGISTNERASVRELPGHFGPEVLEMMKSNSFLKPRLASEANMVACWAKR